MATKTKSKSKTIITVAIIGGILAAMFAAGIIYNNVVIKKKTLTTYYNCSADHTSCRAKAYKSYEACRNDENWGCYTKKTDCERDCWGKMFYFCNNAGQCQSYMAVDLNVCGRETIENFGATSSCFEDERECENICRR